MNSHLFPPIVLVKPMLVQNAHCHAKFFSMIKTYEIDTKTAPSIGECGISIIDVRLILLLSLRILVFQVKQTCFLCMLLPWLVKMG